MHYQAWRRLPRLAKPWICSDINAVGKAKPMTVPKSASGKGPTTAAQRALAEAAERRVLVSPAPAPETGGPKGPEPTRFGDWERKGMAVDF